MLKGHSDSVNVVKFTFVKSNVPQLLLSGAQDGTVRFWDINSHSPSAFRNLEIIATHDHAVKCITVLSESGTLIVGTGNCQLHIWIIDFEDDSSHKFSLKKLKAITVQFLPLAIDSIQLHSQTVLIAVSGTSNLIHLYSYEKERINVEQSLSGHEGWVRSLSFAQESAHSDGSWLLASASQDKFIRLWRVKCIVQGEVVDNGKEVDEEVEELLSTTLTKLKLNFGTISVAFEALLSIHEDWIFSTCWNTQNNRLQLISASMDNSLAIWEAESDSGVWICTARLGEASALKGATSATGSTGGFYNGLCSADGCCLVCVCPSGGWRMWKLNESSRTWQQIPAVSGHTKSVKDLTWARDGSYILTTSADQTTRLHSQDESSSSRSWHEFARPQIHGYDLNCVDSINNKQFVSGADEKLLRVFDRPSTLLPTPHKPNEVKSSTDSQSISVNIPVLGLSNKTVRSVHEYSTYDGFSEQQKGEHSLSVDRHITLFDRTPTEDSLSRHLLWPEREKLYGHGYEISAVAASRDGTMLATACRASSFEHAIMRIYETKEWREICPPLEAHKLTITKIAFSEDDKYLLSVGRDRQWAVFIRNSDNLYRYELLKLGVKGHSRMLLDASWAPSSVPTFATGGRDKLTKIWQIVNNDISCVTTLSSMSSVTAVDFLSREISNRFVLAIGTEGGQISIHYLQKENYHAYHCLNIDSWLCPSLAVNALSWRPNNADQISETYLLAAASEDASLRLYRSTV